MPLSKIPFPKITLKDRVLASLTGNSLAEAQENQEKLKEEAKKHGYLIDVDFSI